MKENNYLRVKVYVFIFFISYTLGSMISDSEIIMIDGNRDIYKYTFNHAIFGLYMTLGFGITLLYDIYVLYKNKKKNKKNE
jgi:hypothetical protein